MTTTEQQLDGLEDTPKTALGFGGKTIDQHLEIGDELYLVMKCTVTSDGRTLKAEDDGDVKYKAGAKTEILVKLTAAEATAVVASYK